MSSLPLLPISLFLLHSISKVSWANPILEINVCPEDNNVWGYSDPFTRNISSSGPLSVPSMSSCESWPPTAGTRHSGCPLRAAEPSSDRNLSWYTRDSQHERFKKAGTSILPNLRRTQELRQESSLSTNYLIRRFVWYTFCSYRIIITTEYRRPYNGLHFQVWVTHLSRSTFISPKRRQA